MWPSFTVRVLQDMEAVPKFLWLSRDGWAIIAQLASAVAVIIAAIYAGSYQKKKDKREKEAKFDYIYGRVLAIPDKLNLFLEQIKNLEKVSDDQLQKEIEYLNIFLDAYALEKDKDFLMNNDELISSFIPRQFGLSVINCTNSFHILFFLIKKLFANVQQGGERSFVAGLERGVIRLSKDVTRLNTALKDTKLSLFKEKEFRDKWDNSEHSVSDQEK